MSISPTWGTGVQLGPNGQGIAENMIKRCRFLNCTGYGIDTLNWNSLDEWVWYCLFQNCGTGVYNTMGNFHVFNSVFLSNSVDIGSTNSEVFAVVGNTSIGSQCFMNSTSPTAGGFCGIPVYVRGNAIYDSVNTNTIVLGGGDMTAIDNTIASLAGASGGALTWGGSWRYNNNIACISNTYTVPAWGNRPLNSGGPFVTGEGSSGSTTTT